MGSIIMKLLLILAIVETDTNYHQHTGSYYLWKDSSKWWIGTSKDNKGTADVEIKYDEDCAVKLGIYSWTYGPKNRPPTVSDQAQTTCTDAHPYLCPYYKDVLDGQLMGTYIRAKDAGSKPKDTCVDNCVYYKDGNEADLYCFEETLDDGGDVLCQDSNN